jgi:hypothetical protein
MDDILQKLPMWAEQLGEALMIIVTVATFLCRALPKKVKSEKIEKYLNMIHRFVAWMPTVGVNPKTKELMEYYEKNKQGADDDKSPQS